MRRWLLFILLANASLLFAEKGSVFCIHGLVSSSKDLYSIRNALAPTGNYIYLWDYPSIKRYLHEHACTLCTALRAVADCHPGEPIHFVTHSSGGLILRMALNRPDCPYEAKIGRVVMFAPCNQGSQLGRSVRFLFPLRIFLGWKSGLELMTYDPCEIEQHCGNFPDSMEVLVIAGTRGNYHWFKEPNDGYVTLKETYLNTPYYLLVYHAAHGEILKWPPALNQMTRFICNGCN